jgi:Predicted nucleotide-binding protein containing TIR-like domain
MTSIPSQLGQCKGSKIMTMSDSIRLNLYLNRFLGQKQHVQNIAGHSIAPESERKLRPRQNVVLELGYFAAKLGRDKTFVLTKGEIELPSDMLGLVYAPMDKGEGWKMQLARELKAAGFAVDLNRAIA